LKNKSLYAQVKSCYDESFIKEENMSFEVQKNSILDLQLEVKSTSGILFFPGAIINNITYRGNINAADIFEDICSGNKVKWSIIYRYVNENEGLL
jgi:hypothetical protein